MQTEWYPGDELIKFLQDAATQACIACGVSEIVTRADVMGGSRSRSVVRVRWTLIKVLDCSMFVDNACGLPANVAVSVGKSPPGWPPPISQPMLGWYFQRDHSSISHALASGRCEREAVEALKLLKALYPDPVLMPITSTPPRRPTPAPVMMRVS